MNHVDADDRDDCPPSLILDKFLSGGLHAEHQERINQHIEACPVCAAKIAGNDDDSELERLLLAPTETPVVSLQDADDLLARVKRPARIGAAGRRAHRRFRFTEQEIARGGMGIIHEGVDIEMDRTVAVKRLKDEHAADRRNIKQFEHEARVTGLLEHPGIVPVYGRGRDPGGRPFFAMRMVEGERLSTAIDRLHEKPCDDPRSPELRRLLARFVTVCNTVAYAHARGFAHLDLKPSNILLGPFGETFTMDWGLAMKIDRPVRRSSGTAQYMSPEQVESRFDKVGPASDVYSLGAVLFTIVTGRRPPSSGDITAPLARATIPRPLHAVCRKAMERQPENRYASPLALADDVERWLADEPVSVLPESTVDRITRYVRRHRSATIAAALVLATITIAAFSTAVAVSLARTREHQALMHAESRADLAVEAVRQFREAVSTNLVVRNRPDLARLRKKLLGEPLKFFEQLREDLQKNRDTSYSTTFKLAKANFELASLLGEIDSKPNAVRAYHEAIALLVPLAGVQPAKRGRDIHDAESVLAESLGQLGIVQRDLGKVDEARASLRRALGICSRRAQESSAPQDITIHAVSLDRLALIEKLDSPGVAISLLEEAVNLLRPIAVDGVVPADPDLLALIGMHLGTALKAQRRLPEAAERFQESISALEVLVRSSPENEAFRDNLASACFNLANLQFQIPNGGNPRAGIERARDLWEGLVREFPSANSYQDSLVVAYGSLGIRHQHGSRRDEARAALTRAREIAENLVRNHPADLTYRANLGKTYINLSDLETKTGHTREAVALLGPARDALRPVFQSRPGNPDARADLAKACGDLARGLLELGRHEEALEAFRESADLELQLVGMKDPRLGPNRARMKTGLLGIARCCLQMGQVFEAAEAAEQLNSLCADDSACRVEIARELALCSVKTKDTRAARQYADRAMAVLKQAGRVSDRDRAALRTDTAFNALRSRADFDKFLADSSFPADPFAQ